MKKIYFLLIGLVCALSVGCSNERQVNGRSMKRALKSVRIMKEYLPKDQKLEFQVAFWVLKKSYDNNDEEFLDLIDGKKANEIIAAGEDKFEEMLADGYVQYQKFNSWSNMIANNKQIRTKQNLGLEQKYQQMQHDQTNNVLYDLR